MKKLVKLLINPAKLIKNDELVTLRGGSEGASYAECRKWYYDSIITLGFVCVSNCSDTQVAKDKCIAEGYSETDFANCIALSCG